MNGMFGAERLGRYIDVLSGGGGPGMGPMLTSNAPDACDCGCGFPLEITTLQNQNNASNDCN